MTIDELKRAALALRPGELAEFSEWLAGQRDEHVSPGTPSAAADATFEADMALLARGTEHVPPYHGSYDRGDVYAGHD